MARKDPKRKDTKEKPKYRWVQIPDDVVFQGQTLSFFDYIVFLTDRDDRFVKAGPGIRMGGRIRDLFESEEDPGTGKPVGTWVKIHPDDYAVLHAVSEKPTCGYPFLSQTDAQGNEVRKIQFGHRITSFVDAIDEALDKEPPEEDLEDGGEEDEGDETEESPEEGEKNEEENDDADAAE